MPEDEQEIEYGEDEIEITDSIKLIKDLLSVDPDAKATFSVETYKLKRRIYRTEIGEDGEPRNIIIEEPVRVKELFDDFRKGFLDRKEYREALNTLRRADKIKILVRNLNEGDAFIATDHLKSVLQMLMLSGSKQGIALKTILTRFIGKYEHEKQKKSIFG